MSARGAEARVALPEMHPKAFPQGETSAETKKRIVVENSKNDIFQIKDSAQELRHDIEILRNVDPTDKGPETRKLIKNLQDRRRRLVAKLEKLTKELPDSSDLTEEGEPEVTDDQIVSEQTLKEYANEKAFDVELRRRDLKRAILEAQKARAEADAFLENKNLPPIMGKDFVEETDDDGETPRVYNRTRLVV